MQTYTFIETFKRANSYIVEGYSISLSKEVIQSFKEDRIHGRSYYFEKENFGKTGSIKGIIIHTINKYGTDI